MLVHEDVATRHENDAYDRSRIFVTTSVVVNPHFSVSLLANEFKDETANTHAARCSGMENRGDRKVT